jgi:heme/copper-type cytochrome/quinol oxidase subunit 2
VTFIFAELYNPYFESFSSIPSTLIYDSFGLDFPTNWVDNLSLTTTSPTTIVNFASLTLDADFTQSFTDYCEDIATSSPKKTFGGSEFLDMGPEFDYLETEIRRRHIKFPHLTREEIWDIINSNGSSAMMDMSLKLFDDMDNTPIDYSNLYNYKGNIINVSELHPHEVFKLAREVDDIDKFESLEHIRSVYIGTAPNVKLYYAEPFIASPSFIHNDLGYLHILQYQFWLWFVFIFLIVFYLVTFLCVVRWCSNRNQPRRETRGVSRSKCGDLITATVPVTWAISIIVSETTDATDYYDGFGTGELIVGVRAYQWGWEYYYPKNVDLNYNLRPSYSTFIGNSLKYNTATEKKLNSNDVWKFYQNKVDDAIITPAHLLILPLDNSKVFNFMNFQHIGANALKESNAFRKIRDHSKVYTTNLVSTPSVFADKYVKLNSLFVTENDLNNSLSYGLKRHHNLTSTSATSNIQSTFLDRKSMDKFLTYNLQYNVENKSTNVFNQSLNSMTKGDNSDTVISSVNLLNLLLEDANTYNSSTLKLLASYPNLTKEIGDDSDKKVTNYPLRKLLNNNITRNNLVNARSLTNNMNLESTQSSTNSYVSTSLDNPSTTSKDFMINCFNQGIQSFDQSVRTYDKLSANTTNYNLSSGLNSLDSNLHRLALNNVTNNPLYYYSWSNTSWNDSTIFNKLASNRMYLEASFSPVMTNNPHLAHIDYDQTTHSGYKTIYKGKNVIKKVTSTKGDDVVFLSGNRDTALASLSASYWSMFWANTNPDLRVEGALKSSLNQEFFYLPPFTNCYDYDFRNAQALEMLEDAFWETSYSGYSHLDYLNILDNSTKTNDPSATTFLYDQLYYLNNLNHDLNKRVLVEPALKDLSLVGNSYANNIQMDDFVSPANLLNTKDFALFPIINSVSLVDDSYISQKYLSSFYSKNSSILLNFNTIFNYPQSYLSVLNNFRADFDDFSWYSDLSDDLMKTVLIPGETVLVDDMSNTSNISQINSTRFSNPITLRSTAKNSIVTYNALQKVFRARFEDGRSNIRMSQFADIRVTQPFMTGNRVAFEKLLGKNKESFYNTTFYTNNTFPVFNDLASANNSLNTYFFDFPFLLSTMNDAAHFVWFDWYTKWSMVEVQPASASKQSLAGVPYGKKTYDFTPDSGDTLADSETYFTRITRARKNYLPLWVYTPYLYTRANVWSAESKIHLLNANCVEDTNGLRNVLSRMDWYWTALAFAKNTSEYFTPSFSNSQKSSWRPYTSIQSYHYNLSVLTDILTRREYLFRQYLERNNKIINLPKTLTANPHNPLINEIRSSFLLIDPIIFSSEYSRDLVYSSLTFFQYLLIKEWLLNWSEEVSSYLRISPTVVHAALGLDGNNGGFVTDSLLWYFLGVDEKGVVGNNQELYKSQYRPLKKGITNMLRLHGTGAVAMPIEIRLQILASSRDVIHSWAIPSAGIKIDCIPGYTSHRIMIFFNPGIYWGQCMEICGRYHHWMPIVVYFMKRDLFFLWCTHFMNKTDFNSTWEINDRQFTDYLRFVSFDKNTWLTEVSKTM